MLFYSAFFVITNFRSTCPPFEMLKGYVIRNRLETPVLAVATNTPARTERGEYIITGRFYS